MSVAHSVPFELPERLDRLGPLDVHGDGGVLLDQLEVDVGPAGHPARRLDLDRLAAGPVPLAGQRGHLDHVLGVGLQPRHVELRDLPRARVEAQRVGVVLGVLEKK